MPDGANVSFPDNMPPEQIKSLIVQKFPDVERQGQLLSQNIGQDVNKRLGNVASSVSDVATGKQSTLAAVPQIVGQGAGAIGDVAGNLIGSAGRAIAPQTYEYAKNQIAQAVAPIGQAVAPAYNYAKENAPVATKTAEGYANIAMLGGAPEASAAAGDALSATGKTLAKAGESLSESRLKDAALKAVLPDLTPAQAIKEGAVARTTPGILGAKVEPTVQQQAAADQLSQIKGFAPDNLHKTNYDLVANAIVDKAEKLKPELAKYTYNPDEFNSQLSTTLEDIKKDPLIVGDAETTANRVVQKMQDLVKQNEPTAAGLLNARQQFDKWAISKRGSVFDQNQTAFSTAVNSARTAANDFIADSAPTTNVKKSLAEQSALYTARDAIEAKAAKQPGSWWGRRVENNVAKSLTGKIAEGGALTGLGGLALSNPTVLPVAVAAYQGIKFANKALPGTLKALGYTLDKTGQLLRGGQSLSLSDVGKLPPREAQMILNLKKG